MTQPWHLADGQMEVILRVVHAGRLYDVAYVVTQADLQQNPTLLQTLLPRLHNMVQQRADN